MKTKHVRIKLDQIEKGQSGKGLLSGFIGNHNVRYDQLNYSFEKNPKDIALMQSIAAIGLTDELVVLETVEGTFIVLKGTRRAAALRFLLEHDEEAFKLHFSDGVPAKVISDATEEEIMMIVADHATVKELLPIEQFYTVSRFTAFGWDADKIHKSTGIPKSQATSFGRIAALADVEHPAATDVYQQCIDALKGRSGVEDCKDVKMPNSSIIIGMTNIASKVAAITEKGGEDAEDVSLDNYKSDLKATKGKTMDELAAMVEEDVPPSDSLRKISEVKERLENAVDDKEIEVLSWVLQREGFTWTPPKK